MTEKESLTKWVKYNHNIFNGITSTSESVNGFKNLRAELDAQSIESIVIRSVNDENYSIEYIKRKSKKSMKILISDLDNI